MRPFALRPRLQPRLRVPWEPLLTREELLRGLAYYGSGLRLQRVAAKLLAGQPLRVYMLGASVTGGGGASAPGLGYVPRFFQFLNASFPHRWALVCIGRWLAGCAAGVALLGQHVPRWQAGPLQVCCKLQARSTRLAAPLPASAVSTCL